MLNTCNCSSCDRLTLMPLQDRVRINLIFELVDLDLKKYMDMTDDMLDPELVQVNTPLRAC